MGAAAYLCAHGITFLRIEPNPEKNLRSRLFVFQDENGTARDLEREFFCGGQVTALAYDRAISYFKHLLRQDGAWNYAPQSGRHGGAR
jgi:hypothetical protein